ncbi:unnamed protein product [Adineta ricciae]|uniref:Uncharacterized protein n=1 Tax=Adineta ricciae TaxID=249248 RepID=A0A814CQT1_ADIRI|nr:unnamed protein product [Adineta ricciae]CAF0990407.1 unnamed protein product [Adineta ricciae]
MEQPGLHVDRPVDSKDTVEPNHLIIWLDKHIGKTGQCLLLKRNFFMITDPTTECERSLDKIDIDARICSNTSLYPRLDGIQFVLRVFDDPTTCYKTIENNLDKRIFLISSGSKGEVIVPRVVQNFPEQFGTTQAIYIFCAKMNMRETDGAGAATNEWALDYSDHILMYDHEDCLLARLVFDIGKYFFAEAEVLAQQGQLNVAIQHYYWSKTMFQRRKTMMNSGNLLKNELETVEKLIVDLENHLSNDEHDIK